MLIILLAVYSEMKQHITIKQEKVGKVMLQMQNIVISMTALKGCYGWTNITAYAQCL